MREGGREAGREGGRERERERERERVSYVMGVYSLVETSSRLKYVSFFALDRGIRIADVHCKRRRNLHLHVHVPMHTQ